MKIIKDPVHGYIEVPDVALALLDSPILQRLRHVRQLGFSYLVYPGSNHTRFEHSLGTMHLASQMSKQLGLSKEEHKLVIVSALLHDIGHGPYSHAIEAHIEEHLNRNHMQIQDLLKSCEISDIFEAEGISPSEIYEMVAGIHPLSGIIHGELDVDRMDYLLRDAHYTGVPYGTVDAQRLIRATRIGENGIVLHESGVHAAESLLIARTLMRPSIYYHHVSRIAEKMFSLAVDVHIKREPANILKIMARMDDAACIQTLLSSNKPVSAEITKKLYNRQLFKRARFVGRQQIHHDFKLGKTRIKEQRTIAEEISEVSGIDPNYILVDIPEFPCDMSMGVQVQNRHDVVSLEEVSPLLTTLNETRRSQWRLGIYTPKQHVSKVSETAGNVLHIKQPTKQKRLFNQ